MNEKSSAPAAADGLEAQLKEWLDTNYLPTTSDRKLVEGLCTFIRARELALRQELEGLVAKWSESVENINKFRTERDFYDDGRADARDADKDELLELLGKHFGAAPEQGGEKR